MEKRTITQVKVYKLVLNPVFGRCEEGRLVAASTSPEALENWYNNQRADQAYKEVIDDNTYHLVFKPESPIHYFNPVSSLTPDDPNNLYDGVYTEWVNEDIIGQLDLRGFTWVQENE